MEEKKQYDNSNRGVMYKPRTDQQLRAIGKIDDNGHETTYAFIRQETLNKEEYFGIYKFIGTMYPKDEGGNPNAPAYKGPFDNRRISMWIKEFKEGHDQAGVKFLSCEIQDKYENNVVDMNTDKPATNEDAFKEAKDAFKKAESGDDWNDQF